MKAKLLSARTITAAVSIGSILTVFMTFLMMYMIVKEPIVIYFGLFLLLALLFWGGIFLYCFQKKLSLFISDLCRMLDEMMNDHKKPVIVLEEESLFSRISHRIERLYSIMQNNHQQIEKEKAELQILVSDISHQTKTSIANLKIINETLLSRTIPEEKRLEFLKAAESQLNKMDFMIQALVKASRLEAGLIILEKKRAPIYETLVAAINGVLAVLEKKNLHFTMDCPEELTLFHDVRWTSEALFNLLDNAVKYTSDGGSIHITVQEWEMYVKIDVSDTGRGIPECRQASIFKRFYREKDVHEIDGIGIGLYISREIITKQCGYIKVVSEINKGSTFSVFLPVKQ